MTSIFVVCSLVVVYWCREVWCFLLECVLCTGLGGVGQVVVYWYSIIDTEANVSGEALLSMVSLYVMF